MFIDFRISELRTLLNNVTPSIYCKSHFGHLRSYSFGHYPRLMTIGEAFRPQRLLIFNIGDLKFHDLAK